MRILSHALLATVALAVVTADVSAQTWVTAPNPSQGACFYEDTNFRGRRFCWPVGGGSDDLPNSTDDEISSILVLGGAEVTVFRDTNQRGRSVHFTHSVNDLHSAGMNDEISSFTVDGRSYGGGAFGGGAYYGNAYGNAAYGNYRGGDSWGSEQEPRSGACFYEDTNYRGNYFCAPMGNSTSQVISAANDEISSIQLFGGAAVYVYEDSRYRGRGQQLNRSVRDLDDIDLDDEISSFRVTVPNFSNNNYGGAYGGGSYGNNSWGSSDTDMTYAQAQRILERGYRSVLGRDPDPGARSWIATIMKNNWSQSQFDNALMQSPEYRNRR